MGLLSKAIETKDDLFVHTLQDMYYAEQKISTSLPKMIDAVGNQSLRTAFEDHLAQTEGHIRRLEQVFDLEGVDPEAVRCEAIDGILAEADSLIDNVEDQAVLDAAIIATAQAVEHYEITRYGTLATWAGERGRIDEAELLGATLAEEYATDDRLTQIAKSDVNRRAA